MYHKCVEIFQKSEMSHYTFQLDKLFHYMQTTWINGKIWTTFQPRYIVPDPKN